MSATDSLREDHKQIRRLDKVIIKCYTDLYAGKNIPISDLEKITVIIEKFNGSFEFSFAKKIGVRMFTKRKAIKPKEKTFRAIEEL